MQIITFDLPGISSNQAVSIRQFYWPDEYGCCHLPHTSPSESPQSTAIGLLKYVVLQFIKCFLIADKLGRAVGAITAKAYRMGLTEESRVWSKRELDLLKRLYPSRTAAQIAEQIGRSERAIQGRIHKSGLRKTFRYEECHRVVKGTREKLCGKCVKWKDEREFYRNSSGKDGLEYQCKKCSYKPSQQ